MLLDLSQVEIFVRPGHTDMRKAINGLTIMVQDYMNQNPLSGSLYLFCNRQRRILKALYWDRNGFCLWLVGAFGSCSPMHPGQKKLEKHKFPWPMTEEDARQIDAEQLALLLKGIDFWHEHTALEYSRVS